MYQITEEKLHVRHQEILNHASPEVLVREMNAAFNLLVCASIEGAPDPENEHLQKFIQSLREFMVSDHSPTFPEQKFAEALIQMLT